MNTLYSILYALVTLLILGTTFWYVPFRLIKLFALQNSLLCYSLCIGVSVFALVCMMAFNHTQSVFLGQINNIAGIIFGFHLFLWMLLLLQHILSLFITVPSSISGWAAISLSLIITVTGIIKADSFKVNETVIPIHNLNEEVKIMLISDVHIGHHRGHKYLSQIVEKTNSLNPDYILIPGDLLDAGTSFKSGMLRPLGKFDSPAFYTTGNHESYIGLDKALDVIHEQGITVLRNELVQIDGIQLIGLDYMNADENTYDAHSVNDLTIKEELPKIKTDPNLPVILMHHSPVGLKYVSDAGIDLMLSGHTHAGQIFPATLMTPFMFPLNKGLYQREDTFFFVSQGAGTFGIKMRIGSSNEINLLHLKPGGTKD